MSNINLIQVQITQLHYIKLKLGKFNIKFLTKICFNTNTNICYYILLQLNSIDKILIDQRDITVLT